MGLVFGVGVLRIFFVNKLFLINDLLFLYVLDFNFKFYNDLGFLFKIFVYFL